jgi:hypothetical protein
MYIAMALAIAQNAAVLKKDLTRFTMAIEILIIGRL